MTITQWLLIAALLGLCVGPVLHQAWRDAKAWSATLDGFALIAVGGLAALHLLPEAIAHGGAATAGIAVAGFLLPTLWERNTNWLPKRLALLLLLGGLAIHAAIESAALGATGASDHAVNLGAAIVFHRLPVGLVVFALVQSRHNTGLAWGAIAVLAVATVLGFFGGDAASTALSGSVGVWLQALVAGSLLHVVLAHHDPARQISTQDEQEATSCCSHEEPAQDEPGEQRLTIWSAVGGVAGLGVVVAALRTSHDHASAAGGSNVIDTFVTLALQSAPALLIAYLLAGAIGLVITPARASWLKRGAPTSQALRGVVFGLPLPICSCGVLPLYQTLIRRGVPATAALGFLIATPELGLDALLLSLPLLGAEMTLARLVAAFAVAMFVALVVGRLATANEPEQSDDDPDQRGTLSERLVAGLRFGLVELFDRTMPWILVGLLIAAIAEPLLGHQLLQQVPSWLQVPLFALIGIPLYVCASGATPVAAIAIYQGVSPGAALAFLLAGPATNMTTFGILSRLHGRRVAALVGITVTGGAIAVGWMVDRLALDVLHNLQPHDHGDANLLQWLSLGALALLALASLFRQGPRGMVTQITSPIHET